MFAFTIRNDFWKVVLLISIGILAAVGTWSQVQLPAWTPFGYLLVFMAAAGIVFTVLSTPKDWSFRIFMALVTIVLTVAAVTMVDRDAPHAIKLANGDVVDRVWHNPITEQAFAFPDSITIRVPLTNDSTLVLAFEVDDAAYLTAHLASAAALHDSTAIWIAHACSAYQEYLAGLPADDPEQFFKHLTPENQLLWVLSAQWPIAGYHYNPNTWQVVATT